MRSGEWMVGHSKYNISISLNYEERWYCYWSRKGRAGTRAKSKIVSFMQPTLSLAQTQKQIILEELTFMLNIWIVAQWLHWSFGAQGRMDGQGQCSVKIWCVPARDQRPKMTWGLAGYNCRFVVNYSDDTSPLTELTKKGAIYRD